MPEPGATFTLKFRDMASGQYIKAAEGMKRISKTSAATIKQAGRTVSVAFDQQAKSIAKARKGTFEYSKTSREMRGVTAGLRRELGALRNRLLLVAFAYQTIKRLILPAVNAAEMQYRAERRLRFIMIERNKASVKAYENFIKEAAALQRLTGYADEQIISVRAMLETSRFLTTEMKDRLIPLILDLAKASETATGKSIDLDRVTKSVMRAMQGSSRSLLEIGVDLGKFGRGAKTASEIIDLLEDRVGGLSEEMGHFSDRIRVLKADIGDISEAFGKWLIGPLEKVVKVMQDWVDVMRAAREEQEKQAEIVKETLPWWNLWGKQQARLNELEEEHARLLKEKADTMQEVIERMVDLGKLVIVPIEQNAAWILWKEQVQALWEEMTITTKVMTDMKKTISDVFYDLFVGQVKTAREYFESFGKLIIRHLTNYIAQLITSQTFQKLTALLIKKEIIWVGALTKAYWALAIAKAAAGISGIGAGAGAVGGAAPGLGGAGGVTRIAMHQGGIARRYQRGGVVGALLEEGEGVVSRRGMGVLGAEGLARLNRGEEGRGDTYIIINAIDTKSFRERLAENADMFTTAVHGSIEGNEALRAVIRTLGTES